MNLETVAKGNYCRLEGPRNQWVIKTEQAWNIFYNALEKQSNPRSPTPHVDFSKYAVLAVFMGQKSSGGYSTEISKVLQNGNNLEVHVQESSPSADACTTMVLTQPYHIAKVKKVEGKIEFKYL